MIQGQSLVVKRPHNAPIKNETPPTKGVQNRLIWLFWTVLAMVVGSLIWFIIEQKIKE